MTLAHARILKPARLGRQELPPVARRLEREHQHSPGRPADFTVRPRRSHRAQRRSACADDELTDAADGIEPAVGVLRGEALVVVIVSGDHDIDAKLVERPPHLPHLALVAVEAGAEEWLVEIRQFALGLIRGQLVAQPGHLRRTGVSANFAVQGEHAPGAEGVAVVTEPWRAGAFAKVLKVRRSAGNLVFVVAGRRPRPLAMPPPGRVVAVAKVRGGSRRVGVVSGSEDRSRGAIEELRRQLAAASRAIADIAGANEDGGQRWR